ncbi:MAG: hypothetical protein QOE28_751 [Solirubrobacteraceae bacterium]|jgi:glycosyltransferase involved in cell wall biosynthesis|nr:hypothetical protein [Solirubrobacteraceae bacterium]
MRVRRFVVRAIRVLLSRYVRARPRRGDVEGAERRVTIMLNTAYGMGGTIRAALNQAGHLAAAGYEVQIISVGRTRDEPFFGFPPGVEVVWLQDRRKHAEPLRGLQGRLFRLTSKRSSVFLHPSDGAVPFFNVWVDIQLMRRLRRRTGFFITTRPGFNLIAADVRPPGLITIGLEQMNLASHRKPLRKSMLRRYHGLDVLAVLTDVDVGAYSEGIEGGELRIVKIPNTVRDDMGPARADLTAKTLITAGRFTGQKGYDLLIDAYRQVAERHPDWRLKIFGGGPGGPALRERVAEAGLGGVVSLEPPAGDVAHEMETASIYVLSSRYEGLPLVLLEAMSKGMAVVSFDCPTGPAEVIDDHRNGLLVPEQDIDGLAAALSEMMSDEELRRRCAAAAQETAHQYTMEVVGPRWEALLDDLWRELGPRLNGRR